MSLARLLVVTLILSGCQFAVQGVDPGDPGDPAGGAGGLPGGNPPSTGSTPALPDAPDLGAPFAPPDFGPTGGGVGSTCDATHPCALGLDCLNKAGGGGGLSFPAGYCTKNCGGPGVLNACPLGSVCTDVDKQHVCLQSCGGGGNNSCGSTNHCCDYGGHNVCVQMSCD